MPGCATSPMPATTRRRGFGWGRASGVDFFVDGDWRNQLSDKVLYPLYMAPIGGVIRGTVHKDRAMSEPRLTYLNLYLQRLGFSATPAPTLDRKSTRLNSSHLGISYAVFCLKKKKKTHIFQSTNHNKQKNTIYK